jgi:hypothetical protein
MMQLAASSGPGTAAGLTNAQLQSLLPGAINNWRAAGFSNYDLHALDNVTVQVTNLSGGLLGLEAPGHIWIDASAAGWGWSINGGLMDLQTVVTHEVGHVLGFGDHLGGNDIMTTTLNAGMRRLPEAPSSTGTGAATAGVSGGFVVSVGASPAVAPTGVLGGELGVAQPSMPSAILTRTGGVEVALVSGVRDSVPPPAAGAFQEGAVGQRSLPGAPPALGQQTAAVVVVPLPVPVAVIVAPVRDTSSIQVPGLWPPVPRVERGHDEALPGRAAEEADQADGLAPTANPDGRPLDRDAEARADGLLPQWACDACFTDGSWRADAAGRDTPLPAAGPTGLTSSAVGAAAVLAFGLNGAWGADRAETERRKRRQWLS